MIKLKNPNLLKKTSLIDNIFLKFDTDKKKLISVINPSTNSHLEDISCVTEPDIKLSINSASNAFLTWSKLLPQERTKILKKWFDLIIKNKEDLALIMTHEQGKPLSECRSEIDYGASFVEFYAEQAKRPDIRNITSHLQDAEVELWLEPIGVAVLVTPWNFPHAMITRKASAALAIGCTVLIHPSPETPFSALALAELAKQAGFPNGVFNVLVGESDKIVSQWLDDVRIRALSFTGSTEIGKLLYQKSASTIKRVCLELGGHAPFIVFNDAIIDKAVEEAIKAKFSTSGQDCLGANRFYIHEDIYENFYLKFKDKTSKLRVGKGIDNLDIGPLINKKAIAKQNEHIEDALNKGSKLVLGGKKENLNDLFFNPTILINVPDNAKIMKEETFGPVAAFASFKTEDEVVSKANSTEYGLMAYLHTQDPSRIYRLSRALEFGMIGVNRTKVTGAPIPFGGRKQSGIGREGSYAGLEAFSEIKYICRDWS